MAQGLPYGRRGVNGRRELGVQQPVQMAVQTGVCTQRTVV
jgi:hypothetical protein